jgi:cell wall-associated NlpC family hydrolase
MWSKDFQLNCFGRYLRWLLIGLSAIVIAGCAGAPLHPSTSPGSHEARIEYPQKIPASATTANHLSGMEQRLRSEVRKWQGTPHRLGGASRRGVDCSGFVQRLYRDLFDRRIPRSTALQVKSGQIVGNHQLRTGDLVFFKVPGKGRHVGIYLGRSEFAHASTSRGVIISSLEERFWRRAYWTARRYLNAEN